MHNKSKRKCGQFCNIHTASKYTSPNRLPQILFFSQHCIFSFFRDSPNVKTPLEYNAAYRLPQEVSLTFECGLYYLKNLFLTRTFVNRMWNIWPGIVQRRLWKFSKKNFCKNTGLKMKREMRNSGQILVGCHICDHS